MPFSTYSELQTSIANWLNREDLTAIIPDFIALAEKEFARTLRTQDAVKRATADLYTSFVTLPAECGELQSVRIDLDGLKVKSPEQLSELRKQANGVSGKPRYYAVVGDCLEVVPTPDGVYTLSLAYKSRIPALTLAAPTNWLLTKHPDLYLYGALAQSAPYLKDDSRVPLWVAALDRVAGQIRMEDERAQYSGATPRERLRPIG